MLERHAGGMCPHRVQAAQALAELLAQQAQQSVRSAHHQQQPLPVLRDGHAAEPHNGGVADAPQDARLLQAHRGESQGFCAVTSWCDLLLEV